MHAGLDHDHDHLGYASGNVDSESLLEHIIILGGLFLGFGATRRLRLPPLQCQWHPGKPLRDIVMYRYIAPTPGYVATWLQAAVTADGLGKRVSPPCVHGISIDSNGTAG